MNGRGFKRRYVSCGGRVTYIRHDRENENTSDQEINIVCINQNFFTLLCVRSFIHSSIYPSIHSFIFFIHSSIHQEIFIPFNSVINKSLLNLVQQISDFFMHMTKKIHITQMTRMKSFVFHDVMFEPRFQLVALSYNG